MKGTESYPILEGKMFPGEQAAVFHIPPKPFLNLALCLGLSFECVFDVYMCCLILSSAKLGLIM